MLVLFDIDDTLVAHSAAERRATGILHAALAPPYPLEAFHDRWRLAAERHFQRYLAGGYSMTEQRRGRIRDVVDASLSDTAADETFAAYLVAYEAAWALHDDVLPCLDLLAATNRLGVVSNGQGDQQLRKLERVGVLDRFDVIVISEQVGFAKPDARIFTEACARTGESPGNAMYVGDRYDADAEGARRAGLVGVWLDRLNKASTNHEPPIVSTLSDVPALIEGTFS